MPTVTAKRERVKPQRSCRVLDLGDGRLALAIRFTYPRKLEEWRYHLSPVPGAVDGPAFRLEVFSTDRHGTEGDYHVQLAAGGDGYSCECLGYLRWAHCKHGDCLRQLHTHGRI
jgi:hypothetical protein